jgi:L-Ala-D/L-Glu epimerase
MDIARLIVHHVRIPLRKTVRHASHERTNTDSLIVRCELSDGSIGWGEGLPREYVTGETIDDAWQLLQAATISEQLAGSISDPAEAVAVLSELHISQSESSDFKSQIPTEHLGRGCFGNSVTCAIEIAVLDAVCRRAGVPLSHVTTLLPEAAAIRQNVTEVCYSGAITSERPLQQMHSALKQRLYGFRHVKVKVGSAGQDDAATLRRLRRILGPRVELRVDANEAWSCETVKERVRSLLPFGISCIEQPVPHREIGGLSELRSELQVPIMLDESLCSMADARRAIGEGLCDLFNIRLSKCGGFLPSLRLAALAHTAGLGFQLGCQVGETGVLSAAGRHFATSVSDLRWLEGSYDRHLVRERLTCEDVTFGYRGRAAALPGPGSGITVDEKAVSRVTVRTHRLV